MSPASQGALEVERYIGSCLITSTGRPGLQKSYPGCRKQEITLRTSKQQQQFRSYDQQCSNGSQFGEVGTWAGGMPLINMASNLRRMNNGNSNQQQQSSSPGQQLPVVCNNQQSMNEQQQQHQLQSRVPLARLAVHTQGAPLILSGRYHNNRNNKMYNSDKQSSNCASGLINNINNSNSSASKCHPQSRANIGNKPTMIDQRKPQQQYQSMMMGKPNDGVNKDTSTAGTATTANVTNIDSLSIASDESSGSNNSENSLPRIIKPRKRRKKDRKPPLVTGISTSNTVVSSASDTKTRDESVAAATTVVTVPTPTVTVLEQQQHPQIKPYHGNNNGNAYECSRYSGDNYYSNNNNSRGPRRSMNNIMRDNGYTRSHNLQNSGNLSSSNNSIAPKTQQEVIDTRQQPQQHHQQQQHQPQQMGNGTVGGYPTHRMKMLDENRNVALSVPICQTGKSNYQRQQHPQQHPPLQHFLQDHCNSEPVNLNCHQEIGGGAQSDICTGDECSLQGSLCQCRYCDPATLIWDVSGQYQLAPASELHHHPHRHHHRHHHHHHHHRFSQLPAATVFLARPVICQEHPNAIDLIDVTDNPCLRLRPDRAAMLRRSWSDPTSYFSDDIATPSRDVGVIGDRGGVAHQDTLKGRSSWRGDASTAPPENATAQHSSSSGSSSSMASLGSGGCGSPNASPGLQGPLEVSTEIVTSPNGHRDLEIKFYSSSPTTSYYTSSCSGVDDDGVLLKGAFGFGTDDDASNDSEEFSDIWSYHESQLQQDFRTLLQAEE